MTTLKYSLLSGLCLLFACTNNQSQSAENDTPKTGGSSTEVIGRFDPAKDVLLAHFDCKTDVDDVHSVAGLATLMSARQFQDIDYHAVAGAYGTQKGLYVPPDDLFELALSGRWSDAHADRDHALTEVHAKVVGVLQKGGDVWIADGGQSDFSADVIRKVQDSHPDIDTRKRFHIVQHADWNELVTGPENLAFAKEQADYHRIKSGNVVGNGTPGFRSDEVIDWQSSITDSKLVEIWNLAIEIGHRYNGKEGRYLNKSVAAGGLDFSDLAETLYIFGMEDVVDANDFFSRFATTKE